jgi:epoxyqueuosine reductase QueG
MMTAASSFDSALTQEIRDFALRDLNADLVGFADRSRYEHAPARMSPQGLMPESRSVIVMAIHHPDAAIELGGRKHPQIIGPYTIQYHMNSRLDELSYRMGLFLQARGWRAVPIVSSNIWRYKGYKEMTEQFAPDLSHLHGAVATGLAEFGYNGLAITPEYGARQRYVSIVTDAPLEPTPLLEPGSVCDNCMLCRKHCRSGALAKELDGFNEIRIADKTYRYARKNLWRCAWGEHFDLDLDLPIPEHVNEQVILDAVKAHGQRGGEMGSCLRHCVPRGRRYFDAAYTDAPRRRRDVVPAEGAVHRGLQARVVSQAARHGADFAVVWSRDELAAAGIDTDPNLPATRSAVTFGLSIPAGVVRDRLLGAATYIVVQAAYDAVRDLERAGYTAVSQCGIKEAVFQQHLDGLPEGRVLITETLLTEAPLTPTSKQVLLPAAQAVAADRPFEEALRDLLASQGAVAVGVAPAERIERLIAQMRPHFDGQTIFDVKDTARPYSPPVPEVTTRVRRLKTPADYLPGARSVIVFGLPLPQASVDHTARHDAEAVGPITFAQYESINLLAIMLRRAIALCERYGVQAEWSFDLAGSASFVANPRGQQHDGFSNRFAAWAAGLVRLGKGGFPIHPEHGTRMRYAALIIDRELPADAPLADWRPTQCASCDRCVSRCTTAAFGRDIRLDLDGVADAFRLIDPARCDWAKRFSLVASEGTAFTGWHLDVPAPGAVTAEALSAAVRQQPPIEKRRPCDFDACVLACPYTRPQE